MTAVYSKTGETRTAQSRRGKRNLLRPLLLAAILLMAVCIGALVVVRINRTAIQLHNDPTVGSVWVAGVTYGATPTLQQGTPPLRWLNRHGIRAFGSTGTLVSRFRGDEGGLEIWFGCRSNLHGQPLLECHRVGKTAFTDDLGQEYQGYLDFQGSYVGVYLPGYDHAAHRLTCALHWMPRTPAAPTPVSAPMRFDIDLPPMSRLLPSAEHVVRTVATQTRQGITVTAGSARLEAPKLSTTVGSQRDLIFHLDVRGGTLACSNVDTLPLRISQSGNAMRIGETDLQASRLIAPWNAPPRPKSALQITDPYGVSLLTTREKIVPMMSMDTTRCTRANDGTVWIAPVNGGGQGTDVIRLHLYVQPTDSTESPVSFDFTLPVRADTEI
jgi:hypothetical protein